MTTRSDTRVPYRTIFRSVVDVVGLFRVLLGLRRRGQLCAFGVGGEHGVERRRGAARRFLRDIADARLARHFDAALVGFELTDHHLHQGRFARAVAADEARAAFAGQTRGRAVEDGAPAAAHGEAL